jgi:hypothetical protein
MRPGAGVFIGAFVPANLILPALTFPGDIDLLVIPYEGDELIPSRAIAIEIKIVRARFDDQGKSPNQFGFSQARALLSAGFPYAAVGHLIICDDSPRSSWSSILKTQVIDANSGRVREPWPVLADLLPMRLIQRSFGRLKAIPNRMSLGFFATHVGKVRWNPSGRKAIRNPAMSLEMINAIRNYYELYADRFLDAPKYNYPRGAP